MTGDGADADSRNSELPDLRRLRDRHRKLERQIAEAEAGVLPIGDVELGARKRERLQVKQAILDRGG